MRDLSGSLQARFEQQISQPCYLMAIDLGSSVLRFSSREAILWRGEAWLSGRFQVGRIKDQPGAAQSADVLIDNGDYSLTDHFTLVDPRGAAVSIWLADGSGTLNDDQVVLLLEGELDAVPDISDVIKCTVSSAGRLHEYSPRHRLLPPLANHLTAPGTIIDWGGERIVLGGKR